MSSDEEEDREIELMLHKKNTEEPQVFSEGSHHNQLKVEVEEKVLLSDYVEGYKPAASINDLEAQIFQASQYNCDSIEATPDLIRFYCKGAAYPEKVGFFIFKNVKVYIEGKAREAKKYENRLATESRP